MIDSFHGEHQFLSNFFEQPFMCGDKLVPTAEHAYQAQKAAGQPTVQRLILEASTPGHSKRMGQRVKLPDDWEQRKVPVMFAIIRFKFVEGSELADMLLATAGHHLVEGNTWDDKFWGCVKEPAPNGTWVGANQLGRILMERRFELGGVAE